jgi:hypothetical protein
MPTAIIFDIEATDKDNPVLVEAAWVALDCISPFTLGEEFHQRYNPGKPISLGALATHHILDEELVDCPPASSFKLPADAAYFIGHNIDFDWGATGAFNKNENAQWTEGQLFAETVSRFKGQSAPVVVLCEVDFEELRERELRKLFVGFTRAQYKVVCLMSERAEAILMGKVEI